MDNQAAQPQGLYRQTVAKEVLWDKEVSEAAELHPIILLLKTIAQLVLMTRLMIGAQLMMFFVDGLTDRDVMPVC